MMYNTVQYSTVQYSTVQYSTVQYSTVQYSTVQYSIVQYSTVLSATGQSPHPVTLHVQHTATRNMPPLARHWLTVSDAIQRPMRNSIGHTGVVLCRPVRRGRRERRR